MKKNYNCYFIEYQKYNYFLNLQNVPSLTQERVVFKKKKPHR